MCKHLKGRSGLCRRFRLGCEKRNRAAGLLNSFNGGSGCPSDCEVNLSREFTLGTSYHTLLPAATQPRSIPRPLIDPRRRIPLPVFARLLNQPHLSSGLILSQHFTPTTLHQ